MNIAKDPTIVALNDILSHIQSKKMDAIKAGEDDGRDAFEHMYRFVVDMYYKKVAEWNRKHPISVLIMNIKHKRRLKRFRKMTAGIRGIWI